MWKESNHLIMRATLVLPSKKNLDGFGGEIEEICVCRPNGFLTESKDMRSGSF